MTVTNSLLTYIILAKFALQCLKLKFIHSCTFSGFNPTVVKFPFKTTGWQHTGSGKWDKATTFQWFSISCGKSPTVEPCESIASCNAFKKYSTLIQRWWKGTAATHHIWHLLCIFLAYCFSHSLLRLVEQKTLFYRLVERPNVSSCHNINLKNDITKQGGNDVDPVSKCLKTGSSNRQNNFFCSRNGLLKRVKVKKKKKKLWSPPQWNYIYILHHEIIVQMSHCSLLNIFENLAQRVHHCVYTTAPVKR